MAGLRVGGVGTLRRKIDSEQSGPQRRLINYGRVIIGMLLVYGRNQRLTS